MRNLFRPAHHTRWKAYQASRIERIGIWKTQIRSRKDQLPATPSKAQVIKTLHSLSAREFESAVVQIFKAWSTVTHTITQTRHVRDSGFDFFGRFVLPPPLSYAIDFLGEAKKYAEPGVWGPETFLGSSPDGAEDNMEFL